jgi:hypothetical protein
VVVFALGCMLGVVAGDHNLPIRRLIGQIAGQRLHTSCLNLAGVIAKR